jgi:hypothetical protein
LSFPRAPAVARRSSPRTAPRPPEIALRRKPLGRRRAALYIDAQRIASCVCQKESIMSENLFSAVLTFSLLAGGAVAFGSELSPHAPAARHVATMPTVTVIGKRVAGNETVTLPTVVVSGRKCTPTELAAETNSAPQRLQ